jgi:hypothetical protein
MFLESKCLGIIKKLYLKGLIRGNKFKSWKLCYHLTKLDNIGEVTKIT